VADAFWIPAAYCELVSGRKIWMQVCMRWEWRGEGMVDCNEGDMLTLTKWLMKHVYTVNEYK
jgi:hypothetical protein